MIEINQIKEALAKAIATKGILQVRNYVSSTSGEVTELLEARYHGPDLYPIMVQETLDLLKTPDQGGITARPTHISAEDWEQAFNEQLASWEKALEGTVAISREKSYDRDPAGFLINKVRPGTIGIEDLRLLSDVPKVTDYVVHKNGVTEAKALLRWRSPLARYIGILTLTPEKADGIEVVEDAHE